MLATVGHRRNRMAERGELDACTSTQVHGCVKSGQGDRFGVACDVEARARIRCERRRDLPRRRSHAHPERAKAGPLGGAGATDATGSG